MNHHRTALLAGLLLAAPLLACGSAADDPSQPVRAAATPLTTPACHVGGCSGQLCSDEPVVITPCAWQAHYACYSDSECGRFGPRGGCGWNQTPELLACMARHGR